MRKLIDLIKDEYLEKFSFIVLLLWAISPLVEYFLQNHLASYYTYYFSFMIRLIGLSGISAYIIYLIKLKLKKKLDVKSFIPEILIFILLIISIISTILSDNPSLSLLGEDYRKEGLIVYIMYIGILLLASIIRDSKYIKYIVKTIIISALIITVLPLFKGNFTYYKFANVFFNTNHYGYYLMINVMLSAFMFIDNKVLIKRIIYLLIFVFFTYLIIRNDTFGCFLSISVSLLLLLIYAIIKKYQRINVVLLILVFAITSFGVSHFDIKIGEKIHFEDNSGLISKNFEKFSKDIKGITNNDEEITNKAGSGRGLLWKEAINYTLNHPIIGGGMESLNSYYHDVATNYNVEYNDRPHNMILQVSSFIGIPGAIIYFGLILYIAFSNLKLLKNNTIHIMVYSTAMAYFISSIFGNSMFYTSPYFMILLGLLIGFVRHKKIKLD